MSKISNEISVEPRADFGKGASRRARRDSKIPAIVYSKGAENKCFLVDAKAWEVLNRHEVGLLNLKEGRKKTAVLVKDVQINTLKGFVVHIDFIEVKMDEEITASVQIHHSGEDAVGLSQGGVLEQLVHAVEVKCLPGDLPEEFDADISGLEIENTFTAKELVLPEGVVLDSDPETVIYRIVTPAAEESVEKADEEGEEGEEGAAEGDAAADAE